jgi:hypothetical protein
LIAHIDKRIGQHLVASTILERHGSGKMKMMLCCPGHPRPWLPRSMSGCCSQCLLRSASIAASAGINSAHSIVRLCKQTLAKHSYAPTTTGGKALKTWRAKRGNVEKVSTSWGPERNVRDFRHLCETLANMSAVRDVLRKTQHRFSGRLAFSLVVSLHGRLKIVEVWTIARYVIRLLEGCFDVMHGTMASYQYQIHRLFEGPSCYREIASASEAPRKCSCLASQCVCFCDCRVTLCSPRKLENSGHSGTRH